MQSEHKITAFIILGIFLISLISADLVFKQSEEVDIKLVCINAGYCSGSSVCNVSVFSPNETILLDGIMATQSPSLAFFNFTLKENQTEDLGEYSVGGFCKDGSVTQIIDFTFEITATGRTFDEGQGIVSVGILFGTLILSFLFLWIGSKLMSEPGTIPLGFFFSVFSLIFAVYALNLSYAFTNDILQYQSLIPVTSTIYIVVLWSLTGFALISAALMLIAFVKELSRTVQRKKMGDDFDPITGTYKLDSKV